MFNVSIGFVGRTPASAPDPRSLRPRVRCGPAFAAALVRLHGESFGELLDQYNSSYVEVPHL